MSAKEPTKPFGEKPAPPPAPPDPRRTVESTVHGGPHEFVRSVRVNGVEVEFSITEFGIRIGQPRPLPLCTCPPVILAPLEPTRLWHKLNCPARAHEAASRVAETIARVRPSWWRRNRGEVQAIAALVLTFVVLLHGCQITELEESLAVVVEAVAAEQEHHHQ